MPSQNEASRVASEWLRANYTEDEARDLFVPGQHDQVRFTEAQTRPAALYVYAAGDDTPYTFEQLTDALSAQLRAAPAINRGTWQTIDVSASPAHVTRELINYTILYDVPNRDDLLRRHVAPDLPWADDHFAERVGGEPLNPPPSHEDWPWHGMQSSLHLDDGQQFSHTYPERFWPKFANVGETRPNGRQVFVPHNGIRYEFGDLGDVVNQLCANPFTRQAYLPVWFPEDTGATYGQRVPCSFGYHFMCDADMRLHVWYSLRACDFVRHFRNDVYFAARLLQWVCEEVAECTGGETNFAPGNLTMTISSLHVFQGDIDAGRLG